MFLDAALLTATIYQFLGSRIRHLASHECSPTESDLQHHRTSSPTLTITRYMKRCSAAHIRNHYSNDNVMQPHSLTYGLSLTLLYR